ncbi:MAG: polymer-forming cytoskeletal protein [Clostridiales bacterium]|nr:polymer-forming cytoskeletal protein [Clostridiales bacterium]
MDNKKNNMKQAMFEMFGVGSDQEEVKKEEKAVIPATPVFDAPIEKKPAPAPVSPIAKPKAAASYLAPGTTFEGTLKSEGDIEVAGSFKGNITTSGTVILRSNIEGNIEADSVSIIVSDLKGDIKAKGTVSVSENSTVSGNINSTELLCSGKIDGDLSVSENLILESTACINGNIKTGAITVMKGAVIMGGIEINTYATKKEVKKEEK